MPNPELHGVNVLVTRPVAQAGWLSDEIRRLGGHPISLPLLEIQPVPANAQGRQALAQLNPGDLLIFVSANAVQFGLAYLPDFPLSGVQIGAIGEATAEQLRASGQHVDLVPAHFDSEGFLALPAIQELHGKHVVIVRGMGGREKLGESLRARGAQVHYLEVYRRTCPHWDAGAVQTALRADVITVTSGEALENLAQLARLPDAGPLRSTPLVVYHERIAGRARELGFTLKPVITTKPADVAMLAALVQWANVQKGMEQA